VDPPPLPCKTKPSPDRKTPPRVLGILPPPIELVIRPPPTPDLPLKGAFQPSLHTSLKTFVSFIPHMKKTFLLPLLPVSLPNLLVLSPLASVFFVEILPSDFLYRVKFFLSLSYIPGLFEIDVSETFFQEVSIPFQAFHAWKCLQKICL